MANRVSGLAGYNTYVKDPVTGLYTKNNTTPVADLAQYTFTNLLPNTDYSTLLFWTSVDNDGNESAKNPYTPAASMKTLNPTPQQSPMSTTDVAALTALVQKCMASDSATGVTVSIVGPKGYWTQSFGSGTGNTSSFLIASQTKTFTGTVILMMLDKGLIASLDDPLSKYLPGYPVDPTIRQIMMMQSGIYDYEQNSSLAQNFTITPTSAMTVDQIIAMIKASAAGNVSVFTPGTKYFYTNSNYYVLAKIAESLDPTKRTIDQIITQDIFGPLGMLNTRFRTATGTPPSPYAAGQDFNPILAIFGLAVRRDVSSQNPAFIWAAGAIDSVISDMVKWGAELRDGTLLSPASHQLRMTTFSQQPQTPTYGLNHTGPPTFGYGLGFVQVGSWFGHDGSWLGYDSCTMFEPVTGTIISVYENFQTAGLLALATIWYELAEYLYPNSANQPGYMTGSAASGSAGLSLHKLSTDAEGSVYDVGSFQPFNELYTAGGLDSVTGKTTPTEASGVYVTLIGGGGPGGNGGGNINQSGGSGGGGGGRVNRIWIPMSLLGPTYDAIYGLGGTPGNPGGDSIFRSGSIVLTAKGGATGAATAAYQATIGGGVGGGWTAVPAAINGIAVTGVNGQPGGTSSMYGGGVGGSDTVNDSPAGGGGGGGNQNAGTPGVKGGDSLTEIGGAGGTTALSPANVDDPPPLHAGAGGGGGTGAANYGYAGHPGAAGGKYGGGGGGGGCTWGSSAGAGGPGGPGAAFLEWK